MTLDEVYKSIDRYLDSDKHAPKLVDVPSRDIERELLFRYLLPANKIMWAENFCNDDTLPAYDRIKDELTHTDGNVFLFGLSTFLKLEGKKKLVEIFKSILGQNVYGKVVIISLGCGSLLKRSLDHRLFDSYRVIFVDGPTEKDVQFKFFERKLSPNSESSAQGLNKVDIISETGGDNDIFITTNHKKADFPSSLIDIKEYSCTYDLLTKLCSDLRNLPKDAGTDEQWNYLYSQFNACNGLTKYIDKNFGGVNNLVQSFINSADYDKDKKWALFIALKIYGSLTNKYLSDVISKSESVDELYSNLYLGILDINRKSSSFKSFYEERKELLKAVCNEPDIVSDFCKRVLDKSADALYYLTNMSKLEEEQIINTISYYSDSFSRRELIQILSEVYPQLADYLHKFDYKNDLLNKYFNEYRFCKVLNRISDTLRSLVDEQAKARDYNSILQPRATYVDKLKIDKSCAAYFVDALGVEYLGYLQMLCHHNGLLMNVDIGRCNLPSVTEFNKEFIDTFTAKGVNVISVKDIDDLMHEGTTNFEYEHTKEPIHISEQLRVLDKLINNVKARLCDGVTDKVYFLSDHGATRMVVINDKETKVEVSNKGIHSGRCCPEAEISAKPDNATEENGYWCLANYDRFKGGRITGVEVHGGATLEEVCVPIITITKADNTIKCEITSKTVMVSFKKKAKIEIYVSKELSNLSISVDGGDLHKANKAKTPYHYTFDIPELKKAGEHEATVYSSDNIIATGLKFEVKKEGASERKFF